jgi:O-antigen ligase
MIQNKIATIFFLILIVLPGIAPVRIISVVILITLFFLIFNPLGNKTNLGFLPFIGPLLFLPVIGLHGIFQYNIYESLKDLWYLTNPILVFLIGYLLMVYIRDLATLMKIILLASVFISLYHISFFVINPELIYKNHIEIRSSSAGRGYVISIIGLAILLSFSKQIFNESRIYKQPIFLFCFFSLSFSVFLSFSRTLYLGIIILLPIFFGVLDKEGKVRKIFILLSGVMILLLVLTNSGMNVVIDRNHNNFFSKFYRSINEVLISDYSSEEDINRYWRGYESYKGIVAYLSGNVFELLAGRGIGFLTNIGIYIKLGDKYFHSIPVFHNGYVYLLVKTGVIGCGLYLLFLYRIFRFGYTMNKQEAFINVAAKIIIGLSIILFVTTFFIAGLFNKVSITPVTLILGSCLSYLQQCRKN